MVSPEFQLLIEQAQSPDNAVREGAETQLLNACDTNADEVFQSLIELGENNQTPLASRLFSLLSLRKFITMYWSPGFESYRGTSNVQLGTKERIRDVLLKLSLDDQQSNKVRNSSSYCVVQISAVDFPDEWPQLFSTLYNAITQNHSLNAMSLLNEIYDDVISEEMFFEGGIGYETLQIIFTLLTNAQVRLASKTSALKLFGACISQMSVLDNNSSQKRKLLVSECLGQALQTIKLLLEQCEIIQSDLTSINETLEFKDNLYDDINSIKENFPRKFFPEDVNLYVTNIAVRDLDQLAGLYQESFKDNFDEQSMSIFENCVIHLLDFLANPISPLNNELISNILTASITLCEQSALTKDSWESDFNEFASKETGLSASFTIRDEVAELVNAFEIPQLETSFELIVGYLSNNSSHLSADKIESALYLLQCLMNVEDDFSNTSLVPSLIEFIKSMLSQQNNLDQMSQIRLLLLIPKTLAKFMDILPNVKQLTAETLNEILSMATNSNSHLIIISALISFTYFASYAEILSVLGNDQTLLVQNKTLHLIQEISEESTEDTNGLLMEVLNCVIDCNDKNVANMELFKFEFKLILVISGKDPANIQVSIESQECLEKLLLNVNTNDYLSFVDICIPSFINIIKSSEVTNYSYSPLLSLVLEFITVFMKNKPQEALLPSSVSEYVFDPLVSCLLKSTEEELLQIATEAFSYMIHNSSKDVITPKLETIVNILDRLLSSNISDSAAMNVGTLILALITEYSEPMNPLLPSIISAAVRKLVVSNNITTQQNLVTLLCFLVCHDPKQTVDFLCELTIKNDKGEQVALPVIIQKWLDTFAVVRGENRIKENIVALSQLFLLGDDRVNEVKVNGEIIPYDGDLIITRSMAKSMPDRYTTVSAPEKIVKMFLGELGFQGRNKNPEELLTTDDMKGMGLKPNQQSNNDEGDDDWEDVDDVVDYEKLQEYVDDEDDLDDNSVGELETITGQQHIPQSIPELLKDFFNTAAQKNVAGFQEIYNNLSEEERKCISELIL